MNTDTPTQHDVEEARAFRAYFKDLSVSDDVIYDRFSEKSQEYETKMSVINYNGPMETAVTLASLFPSNREHVYILDVAAGTGLCAVEFHKYGFRKMDALDPSKGMLEEAEKKNLYTNFICDVIGEGRLDIPDYTYDVIAMCGFCTHIMRKLPLSALEELIRITMSDGYIINTGAYTTFTDGDEATEDFRQKMRTLEGQGRWKQFEVRPFSGYVDGFDGAVSVHQIC